MNEDYIIPLMVVVVAFFFCVLAISHVPSKEERTANEIPHVIKEFEDCKVYAFEEDRNTHYITKCGSTVTTESTHIESCGKGCSKVVSETIPTEGNK